MHWSNLCYRREKRQNSERKKVEHMQQEEKRNQVLKVTVLAAHFVEDSKLLLFYVSFIFFFFSCGIRWKLIKYNIRVLLRVKACAFQFHHLNHVVKATLIEYNNANILRHNYMHQRTRNKGHNSRWRYKGLCKGTFLRDIIKKLAWSKTPRNTVYTQK